MKIVVSLAACLVFVAPVYGDDPPRVNNAAPGTARTSAKAVIQEYIAAWNGHNPAALDPLLGAESVHEDIPAGFRGKGPAEIKAFAGEVFKAQPDLKWHLTKIVVSGSTVAAEWTWTSTYTGDGPNGPVKAQKISARGASFAEVEGGRIKRFVDYYDFASVFPVQTGGFK